jgi:hypothetical protein
LSFASPVFLLALLLLPLGVLAQAAARRRRRRFAIRFPATGTVAAILARTPHWRRRIPALLLALAVTALALALARPQRTVAVPVEQATVVLITDTSRSMQARDVQPTRLDAARSAAKAFLAQVPKQMRVGLVAFSSTPHTVERPTRDRQTIVSVLDSLTADGATATGDALDVAIDIPHRARNGRARRPPGRRSSCCRTARRRRAVTRSRSRAAPPAEDPRVDRGPGHAGRYGPRRPVRAAAGGAARTRDAQAHRRDHRRRGLHRRRGERAEPDLRARGDADRDPSREARDHRGLRRCGAGAAGRRRRLRAALARTAQGCRRRGTDAKPLVRWPS